MKYMVALQCLMTICICPSIYIIKNFSTLSIDDSKNSSLNLLNTKV